MNEVKSLLNAFVTHRSCTPKTKVENIFLFHVRFTTETHREKKGHVGRSVYSYEKET